MMIKRTGHYELLHEVVEHNGILYFAGIITEDKALDMEGQTRSVFQQLEQLLAAHGSSKERVLTALVFITDMRNKPAMNKVWKEWFGREHTPTRATIGVSDLEKDILIEVVFTAAKA
jgi:enamine deaminase RidA (YjgF/YER057c/UK114 family)